MTKEQVKAEVLKTLRKVEPVEELPAFIRTLKAATLMKMLFGEITEETATAVLEAIKEFWGGVKKGAKKCEHIKRRKARK